MRNDRKVSSPCFNRFEWSIDDGDQEDLWFVKFYSGFTMVYEYYFTWRRRLFSLYQSTWSVECYGSEQWSETLPYFAKTLANMLNRLLYYYIAILLYLCLYYISIETGSNRSFSCKGGGGCFVSQFPLGIILCSALYRLGRIPNLSEIDTVLLTSPIFLMIEGDKVFMSHHGRMDTVMLIFNEDSSSLVWLPRIVHNNSRMRVIKSHS